MKILVYHDRTVNISASDLPPRYGLEVKMNSFPKEDGIAIVEQGSPVDWSWPDYTITVGQVEMGRNKRDVHLDAAGEDIIAALTDVIDSLLESMNVGAEDVGVSETS